MGLMNMIIGTKRSRPDSDPFDSITSMANCLMLLSGAGGAQFNLLSNTTDHHHHHHHHHHHRQHHDVSPSRVFECKTCNRQFPSFQALGGHRASHKKPKLGGDLSLQSHVEASPAKPKTHECSVCGQEFAVGQALGGHMRRHRAAVTESPAAVVGNKNSDDEKRIWGLDLNLTPLENDDLDFGLGKIMLNCVS